MAKALLVIGEPATGKSSSLRTLDPKTTFIITPNTKDLPFPGSSMNYVKMTDTVSGNVRVETDLDEIADLVELASDDPLIKTVVIDDFSHYLTHRVLSDTFVEDKGFTKWNALGASVYSALFSKLDGLRNDLSIVVLHHTEIKDDGAVAEKTAGKLMDNTIMVSSWFTVVLHSHIVNKDGVKHYKMLTNKDSIFLAKSPPGMFSGLRVRNDMREILDSVESYYAGTSKNEVVFI